MLNVLNKIGEWYFDHGWIGMMVIAGIWGYMAGSLRRLLFGVGIMFLFILIMFIFVSV